MTALLATYSAQKCPAARHVLSQRPARVLGSGSLFVSEMGVLSRDLKYTKIHDFSAQMYTTLFVSKNGRSISP